jgi:Fe-S-cluster containining protein
VGEIGADDDRDPVAALGDQPVERGEERLRVRVLGGIAPARLRVAEPAEHGDDPRGARAEQVLEDGGFSCPASTECCRFGVTGREPYVTSIELVALQRALGAIGGAAALRARARKTSDGAAPLPLAPPGRDERRCPFLTAAGRCAVYAARPLGCRTFYCDRASAASTVRHERVRALVRRVQEIAARHTPGDDQGRPLGRALPVLGLPPR